MLRWSLRCFATDGKGLQFAPRSASSYAPLDSSLSLAHDTVMVWGANTGIGKTLVSAGLCAAAQRLKVTKACRSSILVQLDICEVPRS